MEEERRQLARAWLDAVGREEIAREIEAVYGLIARETNARRPRCDASGRCCHFEAWGHRLYVTGLEAAYTVTRSFGRLSDGVAQWQGEEQAHEPLCRPQDRHFDISLPQIAAARARGDCPFLDGTHCSAHEVKPLACRTYYCDPSAQDWQQELTERGLARIRAIHDRFGVEYRYGEWRDMLETLAPARG